MKRHPQRTSADEFLDAAYELILGRPPDEQARAAWHGGSATSRSSLIQSLVESEEFTRVHAFDTGVHAATRARQAGEPLWRLTAPAEMDERAIEVPWVLSRYRGEPRVLDIGYAFAGETYLAALLDLGADDLVGVDLAEKDVPGMTTRIADVRALPFAENSFDVVFCVSTLEHVGRDNRVYGVSEEHDEQGVTSALGELRRVLAPGGRLLVTVPCGEHEDHGWFVQQQVGTWLQLFEQARLAVGDQEVYERAATGWQAAETFDESGVRYELHGPGASAVLCAELSPR